jgi:hypothetical protein
MYFATSSISKVGRDAGWRQKKWHNSEKLMCHLDVPPNDCRALTSQETLFKSIT